MHPVRSSWGQISTQLDDVLTDGLVVMRRDSTVWVDRHKRQAANGGGRRGCSCRPVVLAQRVRSRCGILSKRSMERKVTDHRCDKSPFCRFERRASRQPLCGARQTRLMAHHSECGPSSVSQVRASTVFFTCPFRLAFSLSHVRNSPRRADCCAYLSSGTHQSHSSDKIDVLSGCGKGPGLSYMTLTMPIPLQHSTL